MVRGVLAVTLLTGCQADLNKVSLADVDPKAICTDGSPAAYYYKPTTEAPIFTCDQCASPDECGCGYCGSFGGCSFTCGKDSSRPPVGQRCASDGTVSPITEASRTWLIYLEGGGWCYDDASCKSRCGDPSSPSEASVCSSKKYSDTLAVGGIFYPATNDDLKYAHKAFVKYCTSDAHMGDGEAFGFQFRGQLVVQAVLKDLVQSKGLGSGVGGRRDRIVFGGGSAGARGAMVHLDYVKEMLGSAAGNVDVVGFLDSPAWIDKESYQSGFPGFPYITQHVHSYANVQHLGQECAAQHTGDDQWKCMYGQYRLPTLQTPYFVVASQYDSYQLGNEVGHTPSADGELQYANEFAAATRQLASELTSKDGVGAFSWACYNHCVSTSDGGFNSHTCDPDGSTMDGAFKKYLAQMGPKLYQDDCSSFGCGRGCSAATEILNEDRDFSELPGKSLAEVDGLAVVV